MQTGGSGAIALAAVAVASGAVARVLLLPVVAIARSCQFQEDSGAARCGRARVQNGRAERVAPFVVRTVAGFAGVGFSFRSGQGAIATEGFEVIQQISGFLFGAIGRAVK